MIKTSEIRHIRLVNGEELIAEYVDEDEEKTQTILFQPMVAKEHHSSQSDSTVILSNYIPFSEDQFMSIKNSHIISTCPVKAEFKEFYIHSLKYNNMIVEPAMLSKVVHTNAIMSEMLSVNHVRFNDGLKEAIKTNGIGQVHLSNNVH